MFSKIWTKKSTESYSQEIEQLRAELYQAEAVVIGAGSGLYLQRRALSKIF